MLCNQACPRPQLCKTPKEPQTERGRSRRQLIRHFFLSVLMLQRWGKGCILKIIFAKERWGGGGEEQFSYEIIWDSKVLIHLAFLSLRLRRAPRSFLAYYLQAQATFPFKKLFPLVNNVVKSLFPEPLSLFHRSLL